MGIPVKHYSNRKNDSVERTNTLFTIIWLCIVFLGGPMVLIRSPHHFSLFFMLKNLGGVAITLLPFNVKQCTTKAFKN